MFQSLLEAIQMVEQSKREVELRIKARAEEAREQLREKELAAATSSGRPIPLRERVSRLHRKRTTIYSSGSRSSKR
jgi:hypothetical protein